MSYPRVNMGDCAHDRCTDPAWARHLCRRHYQRLYRATRRSRTRQETPMPTPRAPRRARGFTRTRWHTDRIDDLAAILAQPQPRDWARGAPCTLPDARGVDFFPDNAAATQELVDRFCDRCPVRLECAADGIRRNEEWGCWGGTQLADRKRIRRALRDYRQAPLTAVG